MKPITTLILLTTISINAFSQPAIQWQKAYGGSVGNEYFKRIIQTTDEGYIAIGYSTANSGDVFGHHDNSPYDGSDIWITKLDNTGKISWARCYGGSGGEMGHWIEQTDDGGYIFCGESFSTDGDLTDIGKGGFWVVKLNDAGTIQWQTRVGKYGVERAYCVKQTSDGGYIASGHTSGNSQEPGSKGQVDALVVKFDNSGTIQWQKNYGGSAAEQALMILPTFDGNYLVAGYSLSSDKDLSANYGKEDGWVYKINSAGNILWQKNYGGSGRDVLYRLAELTDTSGYVIAGTTESVDGDIAINRGKREVWLLKIDNDGDIQWSKTYGGSDLDGAYDIVIGTNESYILAASSSSIDGNITGQHGEGDGWILSVKKNGDIDWQKAYGGTKSDAIFAMAKTKDLGLVIAGSTRSADGDVSGGGYHGGNYGDAWVVKLSQYSSITKLSGNDNEVVVYPTRTTGNINVKLPEGNHHATIKMTDMLGREIPLSYKQSGNHIAVAVGMLPPSIYLLHVVIDNGTSTFKVEYRP